MYQKAPGEFFYSLRRCRRMAGKTGQKKWGPGHVREPRDCRNLSRHHKTKQREKRDMKTVITRTIHILALLVALALPAFAEESNRGLYEADLTGGGKIVFFVQGKHVLSAYIFDQASQTASQVQGTISDNGSFSLTTSNGTLLTGNVTSDKITATLGSQNITANRTSAFGNTGNLSGRFSGFGFGNGNTLANLKFVVDSQGHIFMIGTQNGNVIGGFG